MVWCVVLLYLYLYSSSLPQPSLPSPLPPPLQAVNNEILRSEDFVTLPEHVGGGAKVQPPSIPSMNDDGKCSDCYDDDCYDDDDNNNDDNNNDDTHDNNNYR